MLRAIPVVFFCFVAIYPALGTQDSIVVERYFHTGRDSEKIIYVIEGKDTVSAHQYYNGKWKTSIFYEKKVVSCPSRRDLDRLYFDFAKKGERYVLMESNGRGSFIQSEYRGMKQHGKYEGYENGELVFAGRYWNGNRWGFWYECMQLPPYKCDHYFVFGRGRMSNREIIWTLPEFYTMCFYAISFPFCLVMAFLLARNWSWKTFFLFLGAWLPALFFSFTLPYTSWAIKTLTYYPFFGTMIYLPVRLQKGNTTLTFKVLGSILFILQVLITWLVYAISTTNFSH